MNHSVETSYLSDTVLQNDSVTILFSGDFMQHLPQVVAAKSDTGYNYNYSLKSIAKLWKSVDFSVVNLETTISQNKNFSGYPMFSSPEEIVNALASSGVDVVALANNHICDKGASGVDKTLRAIENNQLAAVGVYQDSYNSDVALLQKNDFRIAIINFTYGTNGMPIPKGFKVNLIDTVEILKTVDKVNQLAVSHKIIFFHWGYEYVTKEDKE